MTEKPARSFHRLGEAIESGSKSRHRWLRGLLVALVWLLIWQIAGWLIHNDLLLASPGQVFLSLCGLAVTPVFWQTALLSLIRIQAGYLLGVLTGAALAVLTERVTWLHRFFYPAISAIRSTPVASFIILALVWMSSSRVVVFIVFLMVMPIVWVNVVEGIRKTDRQLLEMAYVFHLKPRQILRLIYLPSVSPFFITAATTGLGLGWKAGHRRRGAQPAAFFPGRPLV